MSAESVVVNPRTLDRATRRSDLHKASKGHTCLDIRMKTYRLSPVRTEPTLQIQNRGHYSLMEGAKSSFSMSRNVLYSIYLLDSEGFTTNAFRASK